MYSCPIENCAHPMYDANWKKNRSCSLWLLSDEERCDDYFHYIEDAKSAKYKAKIEFYTNQHQVETQEERRTTDINEKIKHGRFFFYDVIIPMNESLNTIPDDYSSEDIFDDSYEYEEFDEDYIGFNQFEEDNVNLESATIIKHALKSFENQKKQHLKTDLTNYLFFDSSDSLDDNLLVDLFKETENIKLSDDPLITKINNALNVQQQADHYQQAVAEMQKRIEYVTKTDAFNIYVDDFLRLYPDYIKPETYYKYNDQIPYEYNQYIEQLFKFKQQQHQLILPRKKTKFKIVYITSGGGKTTLSKRNKIYLDIDAFIARHYEKFKIVEDFCIRYKDYNLMSLFFKHTFFYDVDFLQGKIILANHPNQLPNQFRLGYNEMIIIPSEMQWNVRFFDENYFSLLAVQGKIKYFLNYQNYEAVIINHFIKVKNKSLDLASYRID